MNQLMNQKPNILFLSFELSGYFMACVNYLVQNHNVTAHIIRYPVNTVAPFKFDEYDNVKYHERKQLDQKQLSTLAKEINPSIIICSGWNDKGYLQLCNAYFGKINTVLTFDNPWKNSLKQKALSL